MSPDVERVFNLCSPEPNTGCWLWLGRLANGNRPTERVVGKERMVARHVYVSEFGNIDAGKSVRMNCGTMSCVNPDHMRAEQTGGWNKKEWTPERIKEMTRHDDYTGCDEWLGYVAPDGYGRLTNTLLKSRAAHRVSYLVSKGYIPSGMSVCHSCDNRSCVNPDHLWLGTQSDNLKDMGRKGRHPKTVAMNCRIYLAPTTN